MLLVFLKVLRMPFSDTFAIIYRMSTKKVASGVAHTVPTDLREKLVSNTPLLSVWEDITPLARNEWICWIISAKKSETRGRRIRIMRDKMMKGERRPCCWAGCIHR